MFTYAGLTPSLPDALSDSLGSDQSWGLLPTHRLGSTLRRTRDNRLLIRSAHDYEKEAKLENIQKLLSQSFMTAFLR